MSEKITFQLGPLQIPAHLPSILKENFDNHYSVYYKRNSRSLLNGLCDKYGSDKGQTVNDGHPYPWPSHTYADFIERHFGHCRMFVENVFECGLGTNNPAVASNMTSSGHPGASLRVWRDYFPSAQVYGADIDREILFTEERIKTFFCDQTSPEAIAALWSAVGDVEFDIMIDDGLHTFEAGVSLFENSFHKLRSEGVYIIEDVPPQSLISFKQYFFSKNYNYDFINLYRKSVGSLGDNSLVVVRKF